MSFSNLALSIFNESIVDYHKFDNIDSEINNPYRNDSIEQILYLKNWIDTVQWHLEDYIRDVNISCDNVINTKRKIDSLNQRRTDIVEKIDDWFSNKFSNIKAKKDATINTESPAWAIDRLSILALKIYHMNIETTREEAGIDHIEKCKLKLSILLEQKKNLCCSIESLLRDIENGNKLIKVYRQMKMYNDDTLNPILYNVKNI